MAPKISRIPARLQYKEITKRVDLSRAGSPQLDIMDEEAQEHTAAANLDPADSLAFVWTALPIWHWLSRRRFYLAGLTYFSR